MPALGIPIKGHHQIPILIPPRSRSLFRSVEFHCIALDIDTTKIAEALHLLPLHQQASYTFISSMLQQKLFDCAKVLALFSPYVLENFWEHASPWNMLLLPSTPTLLAQNHFECFAN